MYKFQVMYMYMCIHKELIPRPTYTKQGYPIGGYLSVGQSVSPTYIEKQVG